MRTLALVIAQYYTGLANHTPPLTTRCFTGLQNIEQNTRSLDKYPFTHAGHDRYMSIALGKIKGSRLYAPQMARKQPFEGQNDVTSQPTRQTIALTANSVA